jgi:hypothetical protein
MESEFLASGMDVNASKSVGGFLFGQFKSKYSG